MHHADKYKDDPLLRDVLAQRADGPNRGRRRRGGPDLPPSAPRDRFFQGQAIAKHSNLVSNTMDRWPDSRKKFRRNKETPPNTDPNSVLESNSSKNDQLMEVLFTDSGYGSAQNPAPCLDAVSIFNREKTGNNASASITAVLDDDDTKTVYSAATTVIPTMACQSIFDVCNDIYRKLEQHVTDKNRESILESLPALIKAFAVEIGVAGASQFNREVMYFVHKHHK